MARAGRLLVATAIALPLLVATGGRAIACSCAPMSAAQTIRRADAIVAGHVVSQVEMDPVRTRTTLAVRGVYTGHVPAEIILIANVGSGGGSSCAIMYPVGANVDPLVLFSRHDGTYEVSACALLTLDAVRARLGAAKPPPPGPAPPGPAPTDGGTLGAVAPTLVERGLNWFAVLGGLAVAVLLMAWALRRAHRERAVRATDGVTELQLLARSSEDERDAPEDGEDRHP